MRHRRGRHLGVAIGLAVVFLSLSLLALSSLTDWAERDTRRRKLAELQAAGDLRARLRGAVAMLQEDPQDAEALEVALTASRSPGTEGYLEPLAARLEAEPALSSPGWRLLRARRAAGRGDWERALDELDGLAAQQPLSAPDEDRRLDALLALGRGERAWPLARPRYASQPALRLRVLAALLAEGSPLAELATAEAAWQVWRSPEPAIAARELGEVLLPCDPAGAALFLGTSAASLEATGLEELRHRVAVARGVELAAQLAGSGRWPRKGALIGPWGESFESERGLILLRRPLVERPRGWAGTYVFWVER